MEYVSKFIVRTILNRIVDDNSSFSTFHLSFFIVDTAKPTMSSASASEDDHLERSGMLYIYIYIGVVACYYRWFILQLNLW